MKPAVYAAVAFTACVVAITGYTAFDYRARLGAAKADLADAQQELHARDRTAATAEAIRGLWRQPVLNVPAEDNSFGPPYNVRVVCSSRGSSRGSHGGRVQLDANQSAQPGDFFVKTCRGYPLGGGPQPR